jgi:hypothetical protein
MDPSIIKNLSSAFSVASRAILAAVHDHVPTSIKADFAMPTRSRVTFSPGVRGDDLLLLLALAGNTAKAKYDLEEPPPLRDHARAVVTAQRIAALTGSDTDSVLEEANKEMHKLLSRHWPRITVLATRLASRAQQAVDAGRQPVGNADLDDVKLIQSLTTRAIRRFVREHDAAITAAIA